MPLFRPFERSQSLQRNAPSSQKSTWGAARCPLIRACSIAARHSLPLARTPARSLSSEHHAPLAVVAKRAPAPKGRVYLTAAPAPEQPPTAQAAKHPPTRHKRQDNLKFPKRPTGATPQVYKYAPPKKRKKKRDKQTRNNTTTTTPPHATGIPYMQRTGAS